MKILLVAVNAKYIHSNLAVYSLRAYAEQYKEHIDIAEYTINQAADEILKGIYMAEADVVAFSCYIWNISLITEVMIELKKVQPWAKIWFGGPEVTYNPAQYLSKYKELDGIVIGEGEQTFLELTEYYLGINKDLSLIRGIAYKESASIDGSSRRAAISKDNLSIGEGYGAETKEFDDLTATPQRNPLSLDEIPFPYADLDAFNNKIIYYESSRGCPYSCSYCLSSIEHGVRFRDINLVKKELKLFLDKGIPQVKFVDRTFNCNKSHTMAIWKFIKDNDNGITNFHFEITADILDEEELNFLSELRPGQIQLEIGVQTTNPDTTSAIQRRVDFDKLASNVKRIKSYNNIHQHLDLIAGLPHEEYSSFERSFNDVYNLRPDQLQLGFLKVLKGSLMEEESNKYGIVYRDTPPYEVLFTKELSYKEVLRLKGICEMVEVYYNSGQFGHAILFLEHFFDSPMKLYEALSNYYEINNLYNFAHSRIRRYEILLDFYKDKVLELNKEVSVNEAVFKEILLYDLCLREDIKSRPAFAPEPLEHKRIREIRQLYNIPGTTRIERFIYDIAASCESGRGVIRNQLMLFDYTDRNPLDYSSNTRTLIIE